MQEIDDFSTMAPRRRAGMKRANREADYIRPCTVDCCWQGRAMSARVLLKHDWHARGVVLLVGDSAWLVSCMR